jgi:hypothetical protein
VVYTLLNFEAKRAAYKVPNVPGLPQRGDWEKVRVFNQLIADMAAEKCSAFRVHTDLICLNTGS